MERRQGTYYACTENGWMTTSVFEEFLVKFAREQKQRSILLILDGHLTHLDMNIAQFARRNDITIIKLPAHTTDTRLVSRNKNRTLQKNGFVNLLCEVWTEGLKPENILSGFRSTGIYLTNRNNYPVSRVNLDTHQRYLESQHQPDHPSQNNPAAENLDLPLDVPGPSQHTSSFTAPRLLKRNDAPDDTSPTRSTSERIATTPTFEPYFYREDDEEINEDESPAPLDDDSSLEDVDLLEPQPDDYEDLDRSENLKPGDFILVKCKGGKRNKTTFKYVATVLRILPDEEIEVMGLKSDGDKGSFIPKE
ncbi:hypothetical protein PR048_017994 [Dryococelus australis]|uniref:DDE-1 domain-containing protein n=1 Tax=Dryococelus australis TaxID=614101 RepID=A0ABQ9HB60_9NEOP|nr:hypothetical protein PR048_017994 [Dryococelus australis]